MLITTKAIVLLNKQLITDLLAYIVSDVS